jgi:hypothetical protein
MVPNHFFHFQQCLMRKVQQMGLSQLYETDGEFSLQVRKLAALAFVPIRNVHRYATALMATLVNAEINQFATYFKLRAIARNLKKL